MTARTLTDLWTVVCSQARSDFMVLPQRSYTYGDLRDAVCALCALFDAQGLNQGDKIIISTKQNDFSSVALFVAAILHGIVPTFLSNETRQLRARGIANEIDCCCVFADQALLDDWSLNCPTTAFSKPKKGGRWFGLGKSAVVEIDDLPEKGSDPNLPETDDALAYLLFTSGTTQAPVGVQVTRKNMMANTATIARVMQLQKNDRLFNDMVLSHTDGLLQGPVLVMTVGACVIRAGGFEISRIEDWLNTARREGVTHFVTTPTVWSLVNRYASHDDYFDGPELKLLMSCAAKLDTNLWQKIEDRFGKPLANEYGLTETVMSALYAGPNPEMGLKGTIGKPVDCEARIDPDTEELQLKGENVFPGYWNNPARTTATFTEDGWLRTGDLAQRLEDGSYKYLGRSKAAINCGGMLIRPEEIDEAIMSHPSVAHAVTVGVPDDEFEEIAVTAVELNDHCDETALMSHARNALEKLKVPKRILVVDEIPRGESGKARLQDLRKQLVGSMAKADASANIVDLNTEAAIIKIAALVLQCEPAMLSSRSTAQDIAGWDSFSQMTLLLNVEEHFSVRLPTRKIAAVQNLGDLISLVSELRA